MIEKKDLIQAGHLFKPHGYKGEINAILDFPREFFRPDETPVFMDVDGMPVPFFLSDIRPKGENTLLTFCGLQSLEDVRPYVNKTLYCLKKDIALFLDVPEDEIELQEDELIGFEVVEARSGKKIGVVSEIREGKEYDYLVIDNISDPENDLLIPLIDEFIDYYEENEDGGGIISLNLPEGLLSLNDKE